MAVVYNNSSPIVLAPPSTLVNNANSTPNYSPAPVSTNPYQSDSFSTNVVPSNYPTVTNNIPANIFPQQTTQPTQNTGTQATQTGGTTTPTGEKLKPVSMSEAQWAVKFEEKVMKEGYQPTQDEMAKYQDIVARYKANPNVDAGILEILAAQSSSLGSQVSAMRYAETAATHMRGLKGITGVKEAATMTETSAIANGAKQVSATSGGIGASLKGLGQTALKGTGLAAIVSGGFSLVTNGIQALQGKKEWSDVGGSVAADTANGAISGLTGTLAAGGAFLAAGALGATGLVSTLIVGLGAMGGAWLGDKLFKGTGLYDKLKDKVTGLFSGSKSTTTQTPQANQTTGAQVYSPS